MQLSAEKLRGSFEGDGEEQGENHEALKQTRSQEGPTNTFWNWKGAWGKCRRLQNARDGRRVAGRGAASSKTRH